MDQTIPLEMHYDSLLETEPSGAGERSLTSMVSILLDQKSRIVANWALRVATLPAFRAMPDLPLDKIQRQVADVLDGALEAIATSDATLDPRPLERAIELAEAHGRERLVDDFGIGDVLAEFHALRREIWSMLWRSIDLEHESIDRLRLLDARIADIFDALTIAASEAWVSASKQGLPQ